MPTESTRFISVSLWVLVAIASLATWMIQMSDSDHSVSGNPISSNTRVQIPIEAIDNAETLDSTDSKTQVLSVSANPQNKSGINDGNHSGEISWLTQMDWTTELIRTEDPEIRENFVMEMITQDKDSKSPEHIGTISNHLLDVTSAGLLEDQDYVIRSLMYLEDKLSHEDLLGFLQQLQHRGPIPDYIREDIEFQISWLADVVEDDDYLLEDD